MLELPEKFLSEMEQMFKDEFSSFVRALNKKVKKSIRFNPLKIDASEIQHLGFEGLESVKWDEYGYYLGDELDLSTHPYYSCGLFYFQEASAMTPVNNLPLKKGDKVLDLCSAPGGKTLQIASKIGSDGFLLSNDISVSRQRASLRNIEKFGLKNVLVSAESPSKIADNYRNYFDAILVDAPCSGEGIFGKDKNTLASWTEDTNEFYAEKQIQILNDIAPALQAGGYLMYSTCTFSEKENEGLVKRFLLENKTFQLVEIENDELSDALPSLKGAKRILPHKQDGMGHFMALMKREDRGDDLSKISKKGHHPDKTSSKSLELAKNLFFDFSENMGINLSSLFGMDLSSVKESERFKLYGEKIYFITALKIPEKSFRILRNGLLLGDLKKSKFIPSQSLANALKSNEIERKLKFKPFDVEVKKYLKGESLRMEKEKGYRLVFIDDYPLGWILSDGKTLKNKFKRDWIVWK